jgi:DNA-binding SARP family transcriptional activator
MQEAPKTEFRVLGPLEVWADGTLVTIRGARQRALLAVLLLSANEVVPVDRLIADLWDGDPPRTARNALQAYVSRVRKDLQRAGAEHMLATRPPGYVITVASDQLDLYRFERGVEEGRLALSSGDPNTATAKFDEALALWRGAPLAEFESEPFAQRERARLEELRFTVLGDRCDAELERGRTVELVPELEALIVEHPLRERPRAQLMLALYRAGRQAEALELYQATRRVFDEELGLEPTPTLQQLESAILRQDDSVESPGIDEPPAPSATPPTGLRKLVTAAYIDLSAETNTEDALDPEALRALLARCFDRAAQIVERHGGTAQLIGESIVALFGVPRAHEDDPLRAVRAAVEVRDDLVQLARELEPDWGTLTLRVGVHTSETLVSELPLAPGPRLDAMDGGDVVVSDATRPLVEAAVRLEIISGADPQLHRVVSVEPGKRGYAPRLNVPMVGREEELALLKRVYADVVRHRTATLATIIGPAGIGKSRLALELERSLAGSATVLWGRCLSYGEGITFWPLAEIVKAAVGDDTRAGVRATLQGDEDADLIANRLAGTIGAGRVSGGNEETFWAVRKLFVALAAKRPLVVVFDDIHWGEPTFLDHLDHVLDWSSDAPILLLCLARPELRDAHPAWLEGRRNAEVLELGPLSPRATDDLVSSLLAGVEIESEARSRIAEAADGVPLFIEQLATMVASETHWPVERRVPPTIQGLLSARLDNLEPAELTLLQRAAVVGKHFRVAALVGLLDEGSAPPSTLDVLAGKGLLARHRGTVAADPAFEFRHLLIRDAAYESIPKQTRLELHERLADWIEATERERVAELEEIVAHHLDQAYRYAVELGPLDDHARGLAERAAACMGASGRRAYLRGDMPAAVALLARSAELLEPRGDGRLDVLADLADALRESGDLQRAGDVLAELAVGASKAANEALAAQALIVRLRVRMQVDPAYGTDELLAAADRAIATFERLGDESRLARAWFFHAQVPFYRGRADITETELGHAIQHAQRSLDERAEAWSLNLLLASALFGPKPVHDGIALCEHVLARPSQQKRLVASSYRTLAGLTAMTGDFPAAYGLIDRDKELLADLGLSVIAAVAAEVYGIVHLLANDATTAELELRRGYERLAEMGEKSVLANIAGLLARALARQGRYDEALVFSRRGEALAAADDLAAGGHWRGPRAVALAARGEMEHAHALAGDAVALASETDFLNLHAESLLDLSSLLVLEGSGSEADTLVAHAVELYRAKGNVAGVARAELVL